MADIDQDRTAGKVTFRRAVKAGAGGLSLTGLIYLLTLFPTKTEFSMLRQSVDGLTRKLDDVRFETVLTREYLPSRDRQEADIKELLQRVSRLEAKHAAVESNSVAGAQ